MTTNRWRCVRCGRYGNPDQGACICLLERIRKEQREGEIIRALIRRRLLWFLPASLRDRIVRIP